MLVRLIYGGVYYIGVICGFIKGILGVYMLVLIV